MPDLFPAPGFSAQVRAASPLLADALTGILLDLGAGPVSTASLTDPFPSPPTDLAVVQVRPGDHVAISQLESLPSPVRVVYTYLPDPLTRRRLAAAKPDAIVLDTASPRLITECLAAALTGRRWLDPTYPDDAAGDELSWLDKLSPRELDVLSLVPNTRCPADIAVELGVAPSTVSVHLKSLRRKIGVHSHAALAVAAVVAGAGANTHASEAASAVAASSGARL